MLCVSAVGMMHSVPVSAGYHSNPRRFLRWINSVKRFRTPILPLSHAGLPGRDVADDAEKASVFNQHFCSVFTNETNLHKLKTNVSPTTIIDSIT